MVASTKPRFQNFLKERGYKWTSEREALWEEIVKLEGHFEAEELSHLLWKKGKRISKATLYRTLPLLVKAGLLKEVIHGEKHRHYEHTHDEAHHDHLICLKCGQVIEFQDVPLKKAEERVCRRIHFRPERILVEIFGYCQRCQ
jgi:Fur family ferric uptake transcriptional regulator